jgi:tetratricopeptide (TPR) repeat protein
MKKATWIFVRFVLAMLGCALGPSLVSVAYNNLGSVELSRGLIFSAQDRTLQSAGLHVSLPHLQAAESRFNEALHWNPHNSRTVHKLEHVYLARGDLYVNIAAWDKAIENYKTALTINEGSAHAYGRIGQILAYEKPHEKEYLDEAIVYLRKAVQLVPNDNTLRIPLGHVLIWSGRAAEAISVLKTGVVVDPSSYAWAVLGDAYLAAGDLDAAAESYQASLTLEPNRVTAWFRLGEIYERKGMQDEAIAVWQHALEIDSDFQPARDALNRLKQ